MDPARVELKHAGRSEARTQVRRNRIPVAEGVAGTHRPRQRRVGIIELIGVTGAVIRHRLHRTDVYTASEGDRDGIQIQVLEKEEARIPGSRGRLQLRRAARVGILVLHLRPDGATEGPNRRVRHLQPGERIADACAGLHAAVTALGDLPESGRTSQDPKRGALPSSDNGGIPLSPRLPGPEPEPPSDEERSDHLEGLQPL